MKTSYGLIIIVMFSVGVTMASCGGSKQAPSVVQVNQETEVSVPCDDKFSDKDFFRGIGVGQSKDLNTARSKARMAANTELAGSVSTLIKRVAEKYVNDAGQVPADYAETFEEMSKEVIQQQLSNVSIACNKTVRTTDNMFKVYMATEVRKDEVFATLERNAAANKKLETIFNREKFRKNFDEEMEAFAKTYGNN
jgi:uncharacterized protein (UPF0333 family)